MFSTGDETIVFTHIEAESVPTDSAFRTKVIERKDALPCPMSPSDTWLDATAELGLGQPTGLKFRGTGKELVARAIHECGAQPIPAPFRRGTELLRYRDKSW
jgi:hypothetical protein